MQVALEPYFKNQELVGLQIIKILAHQPDLWQFLDLVLAFGLQEIVIFQRRHLFMLKVERSQQMSIFLQTSILE